MPELKEKKVLVIGLDPRGEAAARFLRRQGARVTALAAAGEFHHQREALRGLEVEVIIGARGLPSAQFDLAVVSPELPANDPLVEEARQLQLPMMGELELGFQYSKCLVLAIAGTNGKATTAALVERMLTFNHRKVVVAGHQGQPICNVVDGTAELDSLILQVNASQLGTTEFFRPAIAVLLNIAPNPPDYYATATDSIRALGRLFRNQQPFDWAIVQSNAREKLLELDVPLPGKLITFSATDPSADIHLDRGLLVSRIPNWSGPLLDMEHCQLRGPHNAENLMAALAVGHASRLALENMVSPLKIVPAPLHCFELVAEIKGVQFINDSKARNLEALRQALLGAHPASRGEANIWLLTGGCEQGQDFHSLGPLLARRVKRALLFGQAAEKIRASWSLFTPCIVLDSLLEAVTEAARNALPGDIVLLSPACSSLDQFRNYQQRGEMFCQAVKSIGRGADAGNPNKHGRFAFV
jgi:UDP-N-acetylmuramoylalanine--D-glutamate ligase